ncbi:MAG TPA: hypothetical protein P5274_02460 [Candidatus Paceibacterota bacterium]|nr:hypothetical protein [Candidatus Paceibacterota bacterium]
MNNAIKIIIVSSILIVVSGLGGFKYGQSKVPNLRQNQLGAVGSSGSQMGGVARRGLTSGGSMAVGDIIKKDDQSLTLKLRDGGSKIIWYSSSSEINKLAIGDSTDLIIGRTVSVAGLANPDGSIVAKTIQLHTAR